MIPPPTAPAGRDLLAGKVVVITAAAGTGIGSATARRCLAEGASVAISDQHARRLGAAHEELAAAFGGRVWSQGCDVTDEEQVGALIAGAVERFGRIDVLVNNAGLGGTSSVLEMTDEQWLRVLDVTLTGTFRCTRAGLRQLVAQGQGGAVVNNASVLGWRAQPGQAHYAAAKAGVMALTRCAALDVAQHGIRVNAVALRDHLPQGGPGAAERARQRDVHHAQPLFVGHLEHRACAAEARVVHHHVDPPEPFRRPGDQRPDLLLVGHVAAGRPDPIAELCRELLLGGGKPPRVLVADGHRRALRQAPPRRGRADAGASGGGDHHHLAREQVPPIRRRRRDQERAWRGRPSARSAMMPRWISSDPP